MRHIWSAPDMRVNAIDPSSAMEGLRSLDNSWRSCFGAPTAVHLCESSWIVHRFTCNPLGPPLSTSPSLYQKPSASGDITIPWLCMRSITRVFTILRPSALAIHHSKHPGDGLSALSHPKKLI